MSALTALLHRAYAALGAAGLNYTAVDQTVETTRSRVAAGHCFVAMLNGELVGTVVVRTPPPEIAPSPTGTPDWYARPGVAIMNQLGVEPALAGQGIGRRLIAHCEAWAQERGLRWLALDTAEPASHLRALYGRLGYCEVDVTRWEGKRYRSVIMVKTLSSASAGTQA